NDPDRLTFLKAARREFETLLALARREGNRRHIAWALRWLADTVLDDNDPVAAWDLCVEAHQIFKELGDPVGRAVSAEWLARVALQRGDRPAARALLEEQLAMCRELIGSEPSLPSPGRMEPQERHEDEYDRARALYSPTNLLIHALGGMGHLERDEGNYERARVLYQESLVLRRQVGHQIALAMSL